MVVGDQNGNPVSGLAVDDTGYYSDVSKAPSNAKIKLNSNTLNVLNVTGEFWTALGSNINLEGVPQSGNGSLVINFKTGSNHAFVMPSNGGTNGSTAAYTLFNFPNVTTLSVGGAELNGSVFAPFAGITHIGSNNIQGQVIGQSYTSSGEELHHFPFIPDLGSCGTAVVCTTPTAGQPNATQATCKSDGTANNDASISVSGITNGDRYEVSTSGSGGFSGFGSATTFSGNSFTVSGLNNPGFSTTYTIRVYNPANGLQNCFTDVAVNLESKACAQPVCALEVTASPTNCTPATNQYGVSGNVTLTNNASGGTLTVSDGTVTATYTVAAGATVQAHSLLGLSSDGSPHTVTAGLASCGSATAGYTAPDACSVAATITVNSKTVCAGESAVLTASGCAGSVSWSDGTSGNTLTVNTNAGTSSQTVLSYTATCTTPGSTATAIGTVTVNPLPGVTPTTSAPTCSGTTSLTNGIVTLAPLGNTNTAGLTYQYSIGGNGFNPAAAQPMPAASIPGNEQIVTNATEGTTYWVRVTNASGCVKDLSVLVPFSNCSCPPPTCVPISMKRISRGQ